MQMKETGDEDRKVIHRAVRHMTHQEDALQAPMQEGSEISEAMRHLIREEVRAALLSDAGIRAIILDDMLAELRRSGIGTVRGGRHRMEFKEQLPAWATRPGGTEEARTS